MYSMSRFSINNVFRRVAYIVLPIVLRQEKSCSKKIEAEFLKKSWILLGSNKVIRTRLMQCWKVWFVVNIWIPVTRLFKINIFWWNFVLLFGIRQWSCCLNFITFLLNVIDWLRGAVVERRSLNFPCPALDLQLTGNHLCGYTIRYRSAPTRPTQPFILLGSINK